MKSIELILEKNDGLLWGRTTGDGWMATPYGETVNEVINNLKQLVEDYINNEGENDKNWNNIDWEETNIDIKYDLASFFETFNYLNLSVISRKIGINRSLLNQYKTGLKHASIKQAIKIENAIHTIAEELYKVKLVA